MKKQFIITLFFFLLFISCKKDIDRTDINIEGIKNISVSSIEERLMDTDYFKDPQIIILETTDKSILSGINRIYIDDNNLFIFDGKLMQVFSFDLTGKFIDVINRRGQGPGEYVQIKDFAIDNVKKEIIILCDIPQKLMYFEYDGTFIKEENLDLYYMQLVTDDNYIYFEKMNNIEKKGYQINILEKQTEIIKEGLELIDIKNYLFVEGNSLNKSEEILYVRRFDNSIYKLSEGKITKEYNIDFKNYSFPTRLLKEESSDEILKECYNNKYIYSMANAINSNRYVMFKTNIGLFLYDKENDKLNGYEYIFNSKLFCESFSYLPLENTKKIVCMIEDPSLFKHMAERIPQTEKNNQQYKEIINIADKITDENNPILLIYEFKD